MRWICEDCNETFEVDSEDELPTRPAELEDGLLPWERVVCCPVCGGNIYEDYDFEDETEDEE